MGRGPVGPWYRKGRGWYYTERGKAYPLPVPKDATRREATKEWGKLHVGHGPSAALTLKEALQAFLAARRGHESYRKYGQLVGNFVDFRGKETPVAAIVPHDVTRWWHARPTWGETMRGSALRHLKACLNWCVAEGILSINPIRMKKAPRPAVRDWTFSEADFERVVAAAGPEIAAFVTALWHSGARPSELARAKREDCMEDGSAIALATGKQGSRRITFPESMHGWLAARRLATGKGRPLFADHNGRGWDRHTWARAFVIARDAARLPKQATCYQFRHSWITRNVVAGIPLGIIAAQVGTSIAMISGRYAHLQPSDVEKWRGRMV